MQIEGRGGGDTGRGEHVPDGGRGGRIVASNDKLESVARFEHDVRWILAVDASVHVRILHARDILFMFWAYQFMFMARKLGRGIHMWALHAFKQKFLALLGLFNDESL